MSHDRSTSGPYPSTKNPIERDIDEHQPPFQKHHRRRRARAEPFDVLRPRLRGRRFQEAVSGVAYPELPDHPDHALAQRLLPRGAGSVFSFTLKGGRPAGRKFIEALRVFSHLANVGDAKSLVIHPASTTHFRMSDEALVAAGIHPGTIRLSIGLEDADDLLDDLDRGLAAAAKA